MMHTFPRDENGYIDMDKITDPVVRNSNALYWALREDKERWDEEQIDEIEYAPPGSCGY